MGRVQRENRLCRFVKHFSEQSELTILWNLCHFKIDEQLFLPR
jgi:hypothetical protein